MAIVHVVIVRITFLIMLSICLFWPVLYDSRLAGVRPKNITNRHPWRLVEHHLQIEHFANHAFNNN